ncbi:hypothetical protein GCM10012275_54140 [Longimycelium tulufanense]|uniref:SdpA family antimicrobial peptide system protein n=1 Tax=Longimycelium tulufanense TaxID=907463 RepID=A0A8J3FWF1_9PSEU|nr:SdpA family antimicrobial peptide system protein [Longimycelium tulufanense]GGM76585.1 hypothetical protein GCM10012275_54140 [Longimycelium tulufanense]
MNETQSVKPDDGSPGGSPDGSSTRLGPLLGGLVAVWAVIVFCVVHPQLPSNAIQFSGERTLGQYARQILPQGWAFFTKSARDPQMTAWVPTDTGWELAMKGPHAESRNVFGLNRGSRAQAVEMGMLYGGLRSEQWAPCEDDTDNATCLDQVTSRIQVHNPGPAPTLCGPVGLIQREPVPWSWATTGDSDILMPGKAVRLDVTC